MDSFSINEKLIRLYGRDTVYNQPNWRLVWSATQVEKRDSVYEDYTESGIYLGTKKGIREIPKYWYLPPCWILEKFHTIFERNVYDEVREPFLFEPIYPFLDKNNNLLPLSWKPIEMVIRIWNRAEKVYRNQKEEEQKIIDSEIKRNMDIIDSSDPPWTPTFKSSVLVKEQVKESSDACNSDKHLPVSDK